MNIKLRICSVITFLLASVCYGSIEQPITREEFELKAEQQQAKIEELEKTVSEQKKQILDLEWQIYSLKYAAEPNDIDESKGESAKTNKLQIIIKDQTIEIERLETLCRNAGIDPNSNPINMKNLTRKISKKAVTRSAKLSFGDIEHNMHKMNKIRWEEYKKKLLGRKVHWKGWVLWTIPLVGSDDLKILAIEMEDRLACQPSQDEYDVLFWIPTNLAPKLIQGMDIEFKGTIESVTNMYGELDIHLKNASVLRYEK